MSVLLGHTGPASFLDFHKVIPEILVSSSLDGTCRVWNAAAGGGCLCKLQAATSQIKNPALMLNLRRNASQPRNTEAAPLPAEQINQDASASNAVEGSGPETEQPQAQVSGGREEFMLDRDDCKGWRQCIVQQGSTFQSSQYLNPIWKHMSNCMA